MKHFRSVILSKLHQGTCPSQGARGELAYIITEGCADPDGSQLYATRLYVWDDKVTGREVAAWFKSAGAACVEISEQIHDESNEIFEGRCIDGVRAWDIAFITPPTNAAAPQPTPCRVEAIAP